MHRMSKEEKHIRNQLEEYEDRKVRSCTTLRISLTFTCFILYDTEEVVP